MVKQARPGRSTNTESRQRPGHHLHLLTENTANSEEEKMEALLSTSNHRTWDCRDQKQRQSPDAALLS